MNKIKLFFKHLSNWNIDRIRKKERLKIYNQYKEGDISYNDYSKQRKELEERYNKIDMEKKKYFERYCIRYIDDNTYYDNGEKSNVSFTSFNEYPSNEILEKAIKIGRHFEVVKIYTYYDFKQDNFYPKHDF